MVSSDIYIYIAGILVSLTVFYHMYKKEDRRSKKIEELAKSMGFDYKKDSNENLVESSDMLGKSPPVIFNVISGPKNGRNWEIFDYMLFAGGGKTSRQLKFTIFKVNLYRRYFKFIMRPEGIFDKIGEVFVKDDVDFPNYPSFSKNYLLKGEKKEWIMSLFTPEALRYLESLDRRICLEYDGKNLFYYLPEKRLDPRLEPEEVKLHIQKLSMLADLIDPPKKSM